MSIPFTWVYLIHDPFTGLYKIGRSDNPEKRFKDLCRQETKLAAPSDYELLEAWLAPDETEVFLHRTFARLRVRGEWFKLGVDEWEELHGYLDSYQRLYGLVSQAEENLKDQLEYARWELRGLESHIAHVHNRLHPIVILQQIHGTAPKQLMPSKWDRSLVQ